MEPPRTLYLTTKLKPFSKYTFSYSNVEFAIFVRQIWKWEIILQFLSITNT